MYKFLILFSLLLFSIFYAPVLAHDDERSWEQVNGKYKIDVGYDQVPFVAGKPVGFDFSVLNEQTGEQVPFTSVWVRITQGDATVFAAGLSKPVLGRAGMTYTFPTSGSYTLDLRFDNISSGATSRTVVEQEFPVTVGASLQPQPKNAVDVKTILLCVGWGLAVISTGLLLLRRRKKV